MPILIVGVCAFLNINYNHATRRLTYKRTVPGGRLSVSHQGRQSYHAFSSACAASAAASPASSASLGRDDDSRANAASRLPRNADGT